MDVRVGVSNTPKELSVEMPEGTDADELASDVEKALGGEGGVLWLTDRKGRRVGIPADKVAYVEIGPPGEDRRVGFASRA